MTTSSPTKLPSEARTLSLPTLAFVVNPEGHAGIVYDSPTGKRTVIARGNLGPFSWYGAEPVQTVAAYWRAGREAIAEKAGRSFRELAKVEGWSVLVDARGIAKVLERGEV